MPWTKEQRDAFYRNKREQILAVKKLEYWKDPEKFRKRGRECHANHRDARNAKRRTPEARAKEKIARVKWKGSTRRSVLKRMYGITPEKYDELLKQQGGICAICGSGPRLKLSRWGTPERYLHIDHCHKTKKVRGLLCHKCNVGLAMFEDDTERMMRAVSYLLA